MNKSLSIALGMLNLMGLGISSTSQATNIGGSDFGRRYGANGYITNMPVYFKGPNIHQEKKQKKIRKNRKDRTTNKRTTTDSEAMAK